LSICEILAAPRASGGLAHWGASLILTESPIATDLATLVADKIRSGVLPPPPEPTEKYFAGKGTGQLCAVCEQAITTEHLEYELDIGRRTLHFHEKCLDMWRQARG
jgi:hypothetical protein